MIELDKVEKLIEINDFSNLLTEIGANIEKRISLINEGSHEDTFKLHGEFEFYKDLLFALSEKLRHNVLPENIISGLEANMLLVGVAKGTYINSFIQDVFFEKQKKRNAIFQLQAAAEYLKMVNDFINKQL